MNRFLKHWRLTGRGKGAPVVAYADDFVILSRGTSARPVRTSRENKRTAQGRAPEPTKFDLVINLIAAKALRLTIPEAFLLRASEVIE
jgi:hypothetical protein